MRPQPQRHASPKWLRQRRVRIGLAICGALVVLAAVTAQARQGGSNAPGPLTPGAVYEGSLVTDPNVEVRLEILGAGNRALIDADDLPAICDDGSQQPVLVNSDLDRLGRLFDGGELVPALSAASRPLFIQVRARIGPAKRASGFIFYSIIGDPPDPNEYRPDCSTGLLRWTAKRTS